ncbi:hypothetical protein [Catenulispora rubra]|uniref:hypothetical protein n=1 Tax=Catenulispora rubra TaxID=280293 RepID=UPI001891F44E|nr:hypothetical protein [Catenulispora rubra]
MTLMIRYDYVSWEKLFPGCGVDLTALRYEPPDDYLAGAEAALKHLRLGRSPKPGTITEMRDDLRDALAAATHLESCYAAVLFPKPKRNSDHLWLEFTAYDNTQADLTVTDALHDELLDPAHTEVVVQGPSQLELPCGAALRVLQTTVTRAPDGTRTHRFPRLTICGSNASGSTLFTIRSYATTETLTEILDELVTAWARGLAFSD